MNLSFKLMATIAQSAALLLSLISGWESARGSGTGIQMSMIFFLSYPSVFLWLLSACHNHFQIILF